jgi:hypothetical protein
MTHRDPSESTCCPSKLEACVSWVIPGQHGAPADALARIRLICSGTPDLFSALWIVSATHQAVSRDVLAAALKPLRPELSALSLEDIQGLLTSIWHGGQPGFEAVMRARQRTKKLASPNCSKLPWNL